MRIISHRVSKGVQKAFIFTRPVEGTYRLPLLE